MPEGSGHGKKALDIGYGAGRHLVYLLQQGYDVSGFEVAPNAEGYARERLSQAGFDPSKVDLRTFDMHQRP